MNKIWFGVILLCISHSAALALNKDDVRSPTKSMSQNGEYLFAEGRWAAEPGTKPGIIAEINFTSIACDKKRMICEEIESLLFTPGEGSHSSNFLYSQKFEYKIVSWTNGVISAIRRPPVADIDLRISLKRNSATKSFRETTARGSNGANPEVKGNWSLK